MAVMATEFRFRLPEGYGEGTGDILRDGVMRLATAGDEIASMGDYRAQDNKAYSVLLLLSRVIVSLGHINRMFPDMIETLSGPDLLYLQDFYEKINNVAIQPVKCPTCGQGLTVDPTTGSVVAR